MANEQVVKKSSRKRQIIIAVMVVALGAAVFLNWYVNSKGTTLTSSSKISKTTQSENLGDAEYVNATTASQQTAYFTDAALDRKTARDSSMKDLKAVIDDSNATQSEKKQAVETYSKLTQRTNTESDIETVIKAKGISECIVILSDNSCEVIIPNSELDDKSALQIKEIVLNKVDIKQDKVTVVGAK